MADLNIIALSGNLVSTPEVRHTNKGTAVCNLRIANNGYSQDEDAMFIDLVLWGRDAEYAARRQRPQGHGGQGAGLPRQGSDHQGGRAQWWWLSKRRVQ